MSDWKIARKYKLKHDVTCPHCKIRIVSDKELDVIPTSEEMETMMLTQIANISVMDKQKLQEQADIVEDRILRVAGYLALAARFRGTDTQLGEQADNLGEAMNALLEIKQELGLTTNLKRVE